MESKDKIENRKNNSNNDLQFDQQIGLYTYEALFHLPNQIDALNRIYLQFDYDEKKYSQSSLSHLYVISLCTFTEALLRSSYRSYLMRNYRFTENFQHIHLLDQLSEKLEGLSWEALKKADYLYLEQNLPETITNSDHFKSVNILFRLRNLVIHGNDFEVEIRQNNLGIEYKVAGRAKDIYEYLIKKEVFKTTEVRDMNHFELNRESICFFINETLEFASLFSKFISSFSELDLYSSLEKHGVFELKSKSKLCK